LIDETGGGIGSTGSAGIIGIGDGEAIIAGCCCVRCCEM